MSGMTHLISSGYGQGHSTGDPTQTNVVGQRYLLQDTKNMLAKLPWLFLGFECTREMEWNML
jgi:hypothetical protein